MCKGSQTTTSASSYTPNPQALSAYSSLLGQAQNVASTPYVPYTGELVAPVNAQESTGISGINQYANYSLPSTTQALGLAQQAASPITSSQIQQYESPYTQQVVNATQAEFANQNQQQAEGLNSNAIAAGAFGGNRTGVAQANLANQQQLAQAPTIANLENQGYTTGLNTALTEQQAGLMGAYGLAGIGTAGQSSLLSGAGQEIGAGQLQQTTQQAEDTALYNQYLQQQAYPFQTTQYLAGIEGSIGPQMGGSGTASTTSPPPSLLSQLAGAGTLASGLFGSTGAVPYLAALALARGGRVKPPKENIHAIGKLNNGMIIYRFNYKGDDDIHVGIMSPHDETRRKRQFGGGVMPMMMPMMMPSMGGGVAGASEGSIGYAPSTPYSGPSRSSYVPAAQLTPTYPMSELLLPHAPSPSPQQPINAQGVAALAQGIMGNKNKQNQNNQPYTPPPTIAPTEAGVANPAPYTAPEADTTLGPIYYRGGRVRRQQGGGVSGGELGEILDPTNLTQTASLPPPASTSAPTPPSPPLPQPRPVTTAPSPSNGVAGPPLPTSAYTAPQASSGFPDQNAISSWQHSIGQIESGNDYSKIGQQTSTGDKGYGRYQVMGTNVPLWTKQVLGTAMTPDQFLSDPNAQDAVFRAKFGNYVQQYGLEGAARAWYAGPNGINNPNATAHRADGTPFGVTVANYGQRFLAGLGLAPPPQGTGIENEFAGPGAPPGVNGGTQIGGGPTSLSGVAAQPSSQMASTPQPGLLQRMFPNVDFSANSKLWPSLVSAGATMMAGTSPFPLVNIGEGALAGQREYQGLEATEAEQKLKQQEADTNAQKLQLEINKMAQDYEYHVEEMKLKEEQNQQNAAKPTSVETTDALGNSVKSPMIYNPATKQYVPYTPSAPNAPVATPPVPASPSAPSQSAPVAATPPPQAARPTRTASAAPSQITLTGTPGNPTIPARPWQPTTPTAPPPPLDAPNLTGNSAVDQAAIAQAAREALGGDPLPPVDIKATGLSNYPPDAITVANAIANYKMAPLSGYALRTPQGIAINGMVYKINPTYDQKAYNGMAEGYKAFSSGGQQAPVNQTRYFNNAIQHMTTLGSLINGLNNHDVLAYNAIKNWWQANYAGNPMPATFEAVRRIVGDEVIKSIVPGAGGEAERQAASKDLEAAQTPQALQSILKHYQELGAAQLQDLRRQYVVTTGRTDFNRYLTPESRQVMRNYNMQRANIDYAAGQLETYKTPQDVRLAVARRDLIPGDGFIGGDGKVRIVP